jgi:phosphoserine/homoserine phosphotransferase
MNIACLDFEGVLVPEIWISVAEKTGIPELRLTTRDIANYDVLMKKTPGSFGSKQSHFKRHSKSNR